MSDHPGFPLISGHSSLDLVNTEVMRRGIRHDLLRTESDLKHWITAMQQEGALLGLPQEATSKMLQTARRLRANLRLAFESVIAGGEPLPTFISELEDVIRSAPFSYSLQADKLVAVPVGSPEAALGALLAYDALELCATQQIRTLRRCENPDCVLFFMDTSGRRKWCSMKICGNRTKVARHQTRQRTT